MTLLLLGILMFFSVHSVRIVAEDWRARQIASRGVRTWRGIYSFASAVGIVLVVAGYVRTRRAPIEVWSPPEWTLPITSALVLVAFVLIAAAYVPGNRIKAKVGHPMTAGVKTWAFAHLLSNGTLGDMVLFGAFLVWAIFAFVEARRRDRVAGTTYRVGPPSKDVITVVAGAAAWFVFGFWLHGPLIGVRPL
jgi:uncharacterized membrane protein